MQITLPVFFLFFHWHLHSGIIAQCQVTLQDMGKIDQYQSATKHNKAWTKCVYFIRLVQERRNSIANIGLVQERRNSIALAMELRLSCTNLSICGLHFVFWLELTVILALDI